jgi:hypothetical protein
MGFLRWLDDERLKPRSLRERHPIAQDPPPDDQEGLRTYCFRLQCLTAQLWDQVWWLSLPWWKRTAWRLLGFRAPIRRFYVKPGEPWPF